MCNSENGINILKEKPARKEEELTQKEKPAQKEVEPVQREESAQKSPRTNGDREPKNYRKERFTDQEDQELIKYYDMFIDDHKHNICILKEKPARKEEELAQKEVEPVQKEESAQKSPRTNGDREPKNYRKERFTDQEKPARKEEELAQKEVEPVQKEESAQKSPRTNGDREPKNYRKGRFTDQEDQDLIKYYDMFIDDHKHNIFSIIEPYLNRNPKSLRERYCNHLDPRIDHSELSKEEKVKIKSIYETLRTPSFSEIARTLNSQNPKGNMKRRTDLVVRNYLSPRLRREKRIRERMCISAILN